MFPASRDQEIQKKGSPSLQSTEIDSDDQQEARLLLQQWEQEETHASFSVLLLNMTEQTGRATHLERGMVTWGSEDSQLRVTQEDIQADRVGG